MFSGKAHGYHPQTIGLYLDQIVQRVDKKKRSLSQYFQEEIAEPLGENFISFITLHYYVLSNFILLSRAIIFMTFL